MTVQRVLGEADKVASQKKWEKFNPPDHGPPEVLPR